MIFSNTLVRLLLVLLSCSSYYQVGKTQSSSLETSVPNEFIIKFKKGTTSIQKNVLQQQLSIVTTQQLPNIQAELWSIDPLYSSDVAVLIKNYQTDSTIEYIEPNYIYSNQLTNHDPLTYLQWNLSNIGQSGGVPKADIQATEAWKVQNSSTGIKVGILDTGIDWKHPDLIHNIWQNLAEDADGDGRVLEYINNEWVFDPGDIDNIDSDGNGYVDDFIGWDFVNNDNNPYDDRFHGTHVAGIIGAEGNNGIGISGVTWDVELVALKFLGADGSGSTVDAIAALAYATQMGISITNNSWGGGAFSNSLLEAITAAKQAGHLFIAAAGNDGRDLALKPYYPANYEIDNIISVGASDHFDNLTSFSNYGVQQVDIIAPGDRIFSTLPDNQYGYLDGTSMAAPHVAGAVALLWSQCSALNYTQVKEQLLRNVTPLPMLVAKCSAGGRLNVQQALQTALLLNFSTQNNGLEVLFTTTERNALSYLWEFGDGQQSTEIAPTHVYAQASSYEVCLTVTTTCHSEKTCQIVEVIANQSAVTTFHQTIYNGLTTNDIRTAISLDNQQVLAVGNEFQSGQYHPVFYEMATDGTLTSTFRLQHDFSTELTNQMVATTDNGFAITGQTEISNDGTLYFYISKLDANRNLLWTKYIDDPLVSSTTSQQNIAATADGGIIFLGINTSDTNIKPYAIKLSAQGTIEWAKEYAHPESEASFITPTDVLVTADGKYVVVGQVEQTNNQTDNFALTLDATGTIEWWTVFGGTKSESTPKITPYGNNFLITSSSLSFGNRQSDYDIYLVTIASDGTIIQEKELDFSSGLNSAPIAKNQTSTAQFIHAVLPLANNNGFCLWGNYGIDNFSAPLFAQLDNQLNVRYLNVSTQFSGEGNMYSGIIMDDGLIGLGSVDIFTSKRALLLGTDLQGNINGCDSDEIIYQDITVNSSVAQTTLSASNINLNLNNLNWTKESVSYQSETHCETVACQADFTYSPESTCANYQTTHFTNTSSTPTSSEWKIDGTIVATTTDFSYTFTQTGTYIVTLTITNGNEMCTVSKNITVEENAQVIDLGADLRVCGSTTTLAANLTNLPFYSWQYNGNSIEEFSATINANQSGNYTLGVADNCGNFQETSVDVSLTTCDVWAGDVNYDGSVNMQDVLFLGIKNNRTGIVRATNHILWQAQPAADWNDTTPDGLDAKHADCNGDGVIDITTDIVAIDNNYNKSHRLGQYFQAENLKGNIQLMPEVTNLNFSDGDGMIEIDLNLEHLTGENIDFYGLSFTADYTDLGDHAMIETSNSLLAEDGTNIFSFYKDFRGRSLDAAVVRTTGNDISTNAFGSKRICKFIVVDENIVTDTITTLSRMAVRLDNIHLIDKDGNVIENDVMGASLQILFSPDYLANAKNGRSTEAMAVAIQTTPSTCEQGGTATANIMGGTAPYTYQWDNGTNSAIAPNLTTGIHYLTVTDAQQQRVTGYIEISGIPLLTTDLISDSENCTVTAQPSGGASHWNYQWSNHETTPTTTLAAGQHRLTVSDQMGCENVTEFTLSNSCSVLPLELLDFQITAQQNAALLTWRTAQEKDIQGFEIQRSTNTTAFKTVAWQTALNKETNEVQQYEVLDKNLLPNQIYYYQIKIIETDGQFTFSPIRSIKITNNNQDFKVAPHPVSNYVRLTYPNTITHPIRLQVINELGLLITEQHQVNTKGDSVILDATAWVRGVYFILIDVNDHQQVIKLVKQ